MQPSHTDSDGQTVGADHRRPANDRPVMAGISVRGEDIEPTKALRSVAIMFRGMAILLIVLMVMQAVFGWTSVVPVSPGVLLADAVRLIVFAGLLWAVGDLAVLGVKSHYDLRATRILMARVAYMVREMGESTGHIRRGDAGTRADRES
jgi:hypothetical protein